MKVTCKVVPHPTEKGYFMVEFHSRIHGYKYLGCEKKFNQTLKQEVMERYALNCGCPVTMIEFIWESRIACTGPDTCSLWDYCKDRFDGSRHPDCYLERVVK